jgi:hypothetical protein
VTARTVLGEVDACGIEKKRVSPPEILSLDECRYRGAAS